MFIVILVSITKHKRRISIQTKTQDNLKTYKEGLIIALSLAVVFGLGWGFGLLATSYPAEEVTITFQIIFSIFVGAQGTLLFLLHGVRNSDARKIWKGWLTSFGIATRMSYIISSSTKSTAKTPHISQTLGMSTLPRTLPRKVDLSKQISPESKRAAEETSHFDEIKIDLSESVSCKPAINAEAFTIENPGSNATDGVMADNIVAVGDRNEKLLECSWIE